jgi:hypothetical protein
MSEEPEIIFSCEAHNRTLTDAVREFCESYWDQPRKFRWYGDRKDAAYSDSLRMAGVERA